MQVEHPESNRQKDSYIRRLPIVVGMGVLFILSAVLVSIQSSPSVAEGESVVFAVIGDYGDGSTSAGDVATLVNSWSPDFILGAGDNRYNTATFDDVVGLFYCAYLTDVTVGANCAGGSSTTNAFFPVPGNHDYSDGGGIAEMVDYFTLPGIGISGSGTSGSERYYDFVIGSVHVFAIDSEGAIQSTADMDAQKVWLQAQLAASTSPFKLVLVHHAPYSSTAYTSKKTAMQWHYAAWGADAVIAAHDHVYERLEQQGLPFFVNGVGGKSLHDFDVATNGSLFRYNENFGAMRVTANEQQMTFEFYDIDGVLIDTYTTTGADPLPAAGATVTTRIISGDDDVEEGATDGVVLLNSWDLDLSTDKDKAGNGQILGLRFQNVFVPKGANITGAHLEFTVDEINTEATSVVIRAQLANNAEPFVWGTGNVSNRALTMASIPWEIASWDTVGEKQRSPDISALVQELVLQEGWSPNNSVVFVIEGTGQRAADAYESAPGKAVALEVEYNSLPLGC
jgi:hypothetical protein